MSINKWFRDIASATAIMLSCISVSWADTLPDLWPIYDPSCSPKGIHFGFFNGANTSKFAAEAGMVILENRFGERYPLEGPGDPIEYVLYYNASEGMMGDMLEIFEQRMAEADAELARRWELLWDHTAGPSWTEGWLNEIGETAPPEFELLMQSLTDALISSTGHILAELLLGDGTDPFETYEEHKRQLDNVLVEGRKVVFFAYSQGNNFVRGAHEYAMESGRPPTSVKVIHVGSSSKIKVPDSYWVLNQYDVVIALLNKLIEWPEAPNIAYSPFGVSALESPDSGGSDPTGHQLVEIYANTAYHQESFQRASVFDAFETVQPGAYRGVQFHQDAAVTADGTWVSSGSGSISAHTDGGEIVAAYLYASNHMDKHVTSVTFNGTNLPTSTACKLRYHPTAGITTWRWDVSDLVSEGANSYAENPDTAFDGGALVVVYKSGHASTLGRTAVIIDKGLEMKKPGKDWGDFFSLWFDEPYAGGDFPVSLAISFSRQPSYQRTEIGVFGDSGWRMLTQSAGGSDDGSWFPGSLLTVGNRVEDSDANPDPDEDPSGSELVDDEHYNLAKANIKNLCPFITPGSNSLSFITVNHSEDDNVFGVFINSPVKISRLFTELSPPDSWPLSTPPPTPLHCQPPP